MTRVLAVDVGASHVKVLVSGETQRRRAKSGSEMTVAQMVAATLELGDGWEWDSVSVGVPAPVRDGKVAAEPVNLGRGWVGFDFEAAFGKPTRVVNDAAMQALGSYDGGRMLFLGLGTGLGSAMIVDGRIAPMELGHLPYRKATFEDYVGEAALEHHGHEAVARARRGDDRRARGRAGAGLRRARRRQRRQGRRAPAGLRLGDNANAFIGGFRLWDPDSPGRIVA